MSLLLKISILSLVIVIAALLLPGLGSPGVTILAPAAASAQVPLPDYNEPNNNFAEATPLVNGETAWGAITQASDQDYFYLDLPSRSRVNVVFTTNGYLREGKLAFQQAGTDMIVDLDWEHYDDDGSFVASGTAGPGRLFVMISVGRGTPSTMPYEVTVSYVPLTSGGVHRCAA